VEIKHSEKSLDPVLLFDEGIKILAELIAQKHILARLSNPGTPRQNNSGPENPPSRTEKRPRNKHS
jgi:hypothetical protein